MVSEADIVSQEAGFLIPHGVNELQEYVDTLCRLLSNSAELQQMSKECRVLAEKKLLWDGMVDKLLAFMNEAHQLRVDYPRYPISPDFGRELAQVQYLLTGHAWLALQREPWEKHLRAQVQYLQANAQGLQASMQDLQTGNEWLKSQCEAWEKVARLHEADAESRAVANIIIRLSKTLPGRIIIRNKFMKAIGKWLRKRMAISSIA